MREKGASVQWWFGGYGEILGWPGDRVFSLYKKKKIQKVGKRMGATNNYMLQSQLQTEMKNPG